MASQWPSFRVEVLLDGASAIYGSDAVAGVINIITKDNFDGVQIDAGYSNSTHTDVATQSYSITEALHLNKAPLG